MTEPKTLLITGGAGFIGSTLVAQCVARGQQVIVLDKLTYAGHPENLQWIDGPGGYELVVGDINNGALVAELLRSHQVDAIMHCAAESHVDQSIKSPDAFIETNIRGTYSMLEAARHYWGELQGDRRDQFRFLQMSTDEVFGSLGAEGYFSEASPMQPNSPYSASKAAADHLARAWFETYGLPVITTHCSNNYGPRQYPEKLIPHMITQAQNGGTLPVYGDGQQVRDWIHVEDHCAGVYLALTRGVLGSVYCFGGHAEMKNLDVVQMICDALQELRPKEGGYRAQIAHVTDRLGHDRRYAIDDRLAQEELGFTRAHDFASGLRATIEWYLANDPWCAAVLQQRAA